MYELKLGENSQSRFCLAENAGVLYEISFNNLRRKTEGTELFNKFTKGVFFY